MSAEEDAGGLAAAVQLTQLRSDDEAGLVQNIVGAAVAKRVVF